MLPTIQLVSREELDIPKSFWPNSWEGLVKHVEKGGFFRTVVAMRGGMDPSAAQQQLDRVEFSPNLDWDEKDRFRARGRAEAEIQAAELDHFTMMTDQLVPPEFGKLLRRPWGDKALDMSFWSCTLPVEILANEKERKALMSHGQQHPCPLPPPAPPPPSPPPPPANGAGLVADGSESAASGPDNPEKIQH
jgi:hypothetical protein